jgi:hypothetical protein
MMAGRIPDVVTWRCLRTVGTIKSSCTYGDFSKKRVKLLVPHRRFI